MHAYLSSCLTWRWSLTRNWEASRPALVVCMLNPSTADGTQNDATISTLIKFAKAWGFGGLWVVNQYAFRSPHPSVLLAQDDCRREGPLNYMAWNDALAYAAANGGWALAAWGNDGNNSGPFTFWADLHGVDLMCMGITADGSPKHPLARGKHRIPTDQQPIMWRRAS